MIEYFISSGKSLEYRSLVSDRRIPSVTIGVNARIELFLGSSFPVANAFISSRKASCCASLMSRPSVLFNSSHVSSPVARCTTGFRHYLMNPTSYSYHWNSKFELVRWLCPVPFGKTGRVQPPLFSHWLLVAQRFNMSCLEQFVCSRTSAFNSSSVSADPVNLRSGQLSFVWLRNAGACHQHSLSVNFSTVNPRLP